MDKEALYLPSKNSCKVGKSSGLRGDLWYVRVIARDDMCSVLRLRTRHNGRWTEAQVQSEVSRVVSGSVRSKRSSARRREVRVAVGGYSEYECLESAYAICSQKRKRAVHRSLTRQTREYERERVRTRTRDGDEYIVEQILSKQAGRQVDMRYLYGAQKPAASPESTGLPR